LLIGAKGRNWFGLCAGVHKGSFCAQRAALLSAFVRCELLSIVGFAVTFAVIVKDLNTSEQPRGKLEVMCDSQLFTFTYSHMSKCQTDNLDLFYRNVRFIFGFIVSTSGLVKRLYQLSVLLLMSQYEYTPLGGYESRVCRPS
jgi:hypothetical protein